jgi:hypothetical protein
LGALGEKVGSPKADELAAKLVARMADERDARALSLLAEGLGALKEKVGSDKIGAAAAYLVARMADERDARELSSLAKGLGALGEKVGSDKIGAAAAKLVARMADERDAGVLTSLAVGLDAFPEVTLHPGQIERIPHVFKVPGSPCRLVLKATSSERLEHLLRQLRNPLCAQDDWKELAIGLAAFRKQPVDWTEKEVDFAQLIALMERQRP